MKKKCLHILPMNKLSGAEKLALILCKNLKTYEPVVVCGGENLKSIFESRDVKSYSIDFVNGGTLENSKKLADIIRCEDVSIVHAHDNNASINAYISKIINKLDIKIISHIHSCYPWLKSNHPKKIIDSVVRKKYDMNIACGNLVYDFYINNSSSIKKGKLKNLSNAIDLDYIESNNFVDKKIYKKYNIPTNKKIIGYIGRLIELKGIIQFIKEFNKYKNKFRDSIILLVGSGEQEDEIKALIKKLKLEEFFILIGHQEDTYEIYPLIDVFILPSTYEGLPMVILEAMSFKIPIVSMDVGSISELVQDKLNGFLIKDKDYTTFVERIIYLKNSSNIKLYGEYGFNIIKDKYDISDYVNNLERIYDEII